MAQFLKRSTAEVVIEALEKVQQNTEITSLSPGSIARSLVESVGSQIGDFYDIMDYNLTQTVVTTASGEALNRLGALYNIERKRVSDVARIDKQLGSFMFYIAAPYGSAIVIPTGTNVYTSPTGYLGRRFSFSTTAEVTIPAGRTRAYASIQPNFSDTSFAVGKDKLRVHDFESPGGVTVLCTNLKSISAQFAFETDEDFRVRIMKGIRLSSGGTEDTIRFTGLQQEGVRDIRIRQAPYGMGSFEAIVVPERSINVDEVVTRAGVAMQAVKAVGTRMYVKRPVYLSLDMTYSLVSVAGSTAEQRQRSQTAISRYLNSLLPGSQLVYNELMRTIMDSSELVRDVVVTRFAINGVEVLRRNYQPAEDEQIVYGDIIPSSATA